MSLVSIGPLRQPVRRPGLPNRPISNGRPCPHAFSKSQSPTGPPWSALDHPLHPDLRLAAECRREFPFQDDPPAHPSRRPPLDADLQAATNAYLAEQNANPKPFVWTKSAPAILAKLEYLPVPSERA